MPYGGRAAAYMVTTAPGARGSSTPVIPEGLVHDWRPLSDIGSTLIIPDRRGAGDLVVSGGGTLLARTVSGIQCANMTGGKIASAVIDPRITNDFTAMLFYTIDGVATRFGRYQFGLLATNIFHTDIVANVTGFVQQNNAQNNTTFADTAQTSVTPNKDVLKSYTVACGDTGLTRYLDGVAFTSNPSDTEDFARTYPNGVRLGTNEVAGAGNGTYGPFVVWNRKLTATEILTAHQLIMAGAA